MENTDVEVYSHIHKNYQQRSYQIDLKTRCYTKQLDAYQTAEQARFRKIFSTIEHIQSIRSLIEKCNEHNQALYIGFVVSTSRSI